MEDSLPVKLLDRSTIEQQVEVYMRSFDVGMPVEQVIDNWKKEHYENPVHEAYIFGVFDGDRLVSINGYMPMRYRYNGVACHVIQSCVSGTIPEYRGKGIWSKLVTFAVSYFKSEGVYDLLIGFPNHETSYGGFMKMNWAHVTDAINYLMVVNGKNFAREMTNKNIPLTGIFGAQRAKIGLTNTSGFRTGEPLPIFGGDDAKGFSLVADEAFLEWKKRYRDLRCFGVYTSDGRPVANCRYLLGSYHSGEIVKLCDIKLADRTKKEVSVYAYCIKQLVKRHPDAAFIRVWAMDGSPAEKIWRRLLFVKVGNGKHANPFITYTLKTDVISEDAMHAKENWTNATFLDLD